MTDRDFIRIAMSHHIVADNRMLECFREIVEYSDGDTRQVLVAPTQGADPFFDVQAAKFLPDGTVSVHGDGPTQGADARPVAIYQLRVLRAELSLSISDPMWADHVELPKRALKRWHAAIDTIIKSSETT